MWKLEHAEGQREINELHVPVGRDVKLIMTSQDVIHSFFVPAFRMKQDVLPGRYTVAWFHATKARHLSPVLCRILRHAALRHDRLDRRHGAGAVRSLDERRLDRAALGVTGEKIFAELGCVTCHRADTQGRGPNLQGVFGKPVLLEDGRTVTADENYVRESILDPGAKIVNGFKPVMPTFQGLVSEEQLNALVAYVKSLAQPGANRSQDATADHGCSARQPPGAGSQVQ